MLYEKPGHGKLTCESQAQRVQLLRLVFRAFTARHSRFRLFSRKPGTCGTAR